MTDRCRDNARFYRGYASPVASDSDAQNEWCERVCACGNPHLGLRADLASRCFDCSNRDNPFAQKAIRMSVDATGEDSTLPARVAEGTHIYNLGLPGVDTPTGERDAYGQMKVTSRPQAHNEIASSRRLREAAKRAGLTPLETQKRAVGGRS